MTANVNIIGLAREVYKGLPTTLCAGCGHNSITNHLIKALYEYGVEPHQLAKMSGIGCSSKTPAYFVEQAHGFNGLHGRMPSAATGAKLANRQLLVLGISGDGDTASIGLGQYCHMIRRNVRLHLHRREQRLLWIDQGPVLGDRRRRLDAEGRKGQRVRHHSISAAWPSSWAQPSSPAPSPVTVSSSFRCSKAAFSASRHRDSRRHQSMRHVQRSRRLDQELCLRQGTRRGLAYCRLYSRRP